MINIWTIASMTGQGGSACAQNDVCTIRDLLAVVITCDFRGGGGGTIVITIIGPLLGKRGCWCVCVRVCEMCAYWVMLVTF